MKVPIKWLKEYVDTNKSIKEMAKSFTALGLMLDKISGDVLDLEHRMDRSDWLSVIGCTRDFAAFEDLKLKYPKLHTEKGRKPSKDQIVRIEVKCKDKVNRFNTKVFRNIKVGKSPDWLKERLEEYGMPSINSVVDITNYVMIEFGQPLHAQDLSKLKKQEIVIRDTRKGDKVTTLLGETIELGGTGAFVLTQDDIPTVIGGIIGGITTGVDENTTDIVLDAGNYNQNVIRKVSRKLKIQNETVLRCDKFLHPDLTEIALQRATYLTLNTCGGEYYENIDWYESREKYKPKKQTLTLERLKLLSGMDLKLSEAKSILKRLEYKILKENKEEIEVEVPYFRTDVEVEDDLVADVLRINDYEKIPLQKVNTAPPKDITPKIYLFEEKLRDICVNLGLYEHITDPMVKGIETNVNQIILQNSLTSEKDALRTSIYETLIPIINTYNKHKQSRVGVFEVGKIYFKDNSQYKEENVLEVIFKDSSLSSYDNSKEVKRILAGILQNIGIDNLGYEKKDKDKKTIIYSNLVEVGEIRVDSFSLFTQRLMEISKEPKRIISEFINYTIQDLSIVLDITKSFGDIYQEIKNYNDSILSCDVVEEYAMEGNKKSMLVRITFDTSNISEIRDSLINKLKEKYSVEIRE